MFRATWRVGGLSKELLRRVRSIITPVRIPFRVLITPLCTYLLSPPTLQVMGFEDSEYLAQGLGFKITGLGL